MTRIVWTVLIGLTCLQSTSVFGVYRRGNSRGGGGYTSPLQGMAAVINANSNAALKYEETRSKYIDNRLKWQKAYYEMTSNYQTHVEERNTRQVAVRDQWLENRTSGAPARLSPSQFKPSTGNITWPEALQGDDFAADRKRIEELFELRAHSSGGTHVSHEIRLKADDMLTSLKQHVTEIAPNEYVSARKFLDSLSYEVQFAPQ